jgi:hypothetical protein
MTFEDFDEEQRFREAWDAVEIARPVSYSLFTFGESLLPYYLIMGERTLSDPVTVSKGEVRIERPMIITPQSGNPEFEDFFESLEEEGVAQFILSRSARFSNLKFRNRKGSKRRVEDSVEGAVEKLNRQLDAEEEDRVAILTAPPRLGGVAVFRYAAERVWESGPDNIQELRERGFLP